MNETALEETAAAEFMPLREEQLGIDSIVRRIRAMDPPAQPDDPRLESSTPNAALPPQP